MRHKVVVAIFRDIKAARLHGSGGSPKSSEEGVHCLACQWDASLNANGDCF